MTNTGFNSRTHEGCDRQEGLTMWCRRSFNSRTHEGCDLEEGSLRASMQRFNSRTHEGCDTFRIIFVPLGYRFNSRTRKGCDLASPSSPRSQPSFQFTHPQGVRRPSDVWGVLR